MMTNSHKAGSLSLFIANLKQIIVKKRFLLLTVVVLFIGVAIFFSLFMPRYISEAMLIVKPNHDPTKLYNDIFDIPSNESFLSTQLSLLSSRPILSGTLVSFYPQLEVTEKEINKLRSSLSLKRLPLNNLILIKLIWNSEKEVQPLLYDYLKCYKYWYEESIRGDAVRLDEFLSKEIEIRKSELDIAESNLLTLLKKNNINSFDLEKRYSEVTNQYSIYDKKFQEASVALIELEAQKRKLNNLIRKETRIDAVTLTASHKLAKLEKDLEIAQSEMAEFRKLHSYDTEQIRERQIKIKFLQDELKRNIGMFLSGTDTEESDDLEDWKKNFVHVELDIIATRSQIIFLEKMIKENRDQFTQLNLLMIKKKKLEKIIGVKESSYMELLYKQEKNKAFLANHNSANIKIISQPTKAKMSNHILKTFIYGIICSIFLNMVIIYFYIGRENSQTDQLD